MAFRNLAEKFAADSHVRGRQFEQLCRWYLQNAPERTAALTPFLEEYNSDRPHTALGGLTL